VTSAHSVGNISAPDTDLEITPAAEPGDLVLERLPSGELAWLRPSTERPEADEARWSLTDEGRYLLARGRAMQALFGPWPSVADTLRVKGRAA